MYKGITSKQNTSVTSGSILYMDFTNSNCYTGSGNITYDISGKGYSGSLTNSPVFSTLRGGSFDFNGTNQYMNFPPAADLFTSSVFSVMFWFSPGTLVGGAQLDNVLTNGENQSPTSFGPTSNYNGYSNTFSTAVLKGAGNNTVGTVAENNIVTSGSWYHYASVYDGNQATDATKLKLYINGVQKTLVYDQSVPSIPYFDTGTTMALASGSGNQGFFRGKIANMFIYNRVLQQSEIILHYSQSVGTYR